jgi:hypothetical protein
MAKKYNRSEQMAYDNGYRAVYEDNAFNGRYFQKDGKIWIHDLSALKHTLGEYDENELRDRGYDVDAYYEFH